VVHDLPGAPPVTQVGRAGRGYDGAGARAALSGCRDRDGPRAWLSLFAPDAVVEDPIGPSPLDPEGVGHRGPAAIAAFYDTVIAPAGRITFQIERSYLCGDGLADGDPASLQEVANMARDYVAALPAQSFPTMVGLADEFALADRDERFDLLIDIFVDGLARHAAVG
jgi:SnoaL-like domain